MAADAKVRAGKSMVILPASFYGGARHLRECFLRCCAISRVMSEATYFFTLTYDLSNPVVTASLRQNGGQQVIWHRPDLISRNFQTITNAFFDDVCNHKILGRCKAYVGVVEDQENGK